MSCNTVHLIEDSDYGCLALEQGASLGYSPGRCLTFILTGEGITAAQANWTPVGQITSNYYDKSPIVYATFGFAPLVYGTFAVSDHSPQTGVAIMPQLTFTQAKAIPVPKLPWINADSATVGKDCWLWEIRLDPQDGRVAIPIVPPSYVQVLGRAAA